MNKTEQSTGDIIELEHVIGYSGKYLKTIHFLPNSNSMFIYSIGGLIVLENINDKHNQRFLKGHDMAVTALIIGASGRYMASGQLGTIYGKTNDAPIILWDLKELKPIQVFKGLKGCVTNLAFSPDERFLAATGENNYLYIWNVQDYSVVASRISEIPISLINWGDIKKIGKHPSYSLTTSNTQNIFVNTLEFDVGSMQYKLKASAVQLPNTGLIRNYTCSIIDSTGDWLYAGTTGGEICVFNVSNRIFKAAIPVSNNGVYSIAQRGDTLFVGSGDSKIKKLVGKESKFVIEREVVVEGKVVSLSITNDNEELLAGTSIGKIYRSLTKNLTTTLHTEGHVESINDLSFRKDLINYFATIDAGGIILIWDTNSLNVITRCIPNTANRVRGYAICIADDNTVVTGWQDGFIRCFEITKNKYSPLKWEIANAHKGAVTCVYADANYILSGGEDGIVRVWSRTIRKLVTQITAHKKDITRVFPDIQKPNIIHSCSIDKVVHTYDLKTEKKIILHQSKNGMILDMSQRRDNELELVTCGHNTPIFFWDCDMVEPVDIIEYPYKLLAIDVSPSGNYLIVGAETSEILLFDMKTKKFLGKYDAHSGPVTRLKFAPDEKQIVSVSMDSSLCIWNFFG